MRYPDDPIPGCVPEYYRERQEEQDRQYDMAMRRRKRYQANQRKLDLSRRCHRTRQTGGVSG